MEYVKKQEPLRIPQHRGVKADTRPITLSCKTDAETADRVNQVLSKTYLNRSELVERCVQYALDHIEFV